MAFPARGGHNNSSPPARPGERGGKGNGLFDN